eukprot:482169_1
MKHKLEWILLFSFDFILMLLWICTLQQLCITKVANSKRLCNTVLISCFATFAMIYSTLGYLSKMYPNYIIFHNPYITVTTMTHISNAFIMVFGFHIFRAFALAVIHKIYISINMKNSKLMRITFNLMEVCLIIVLIICYMFAYVLPDFIPWMHILYILFGLFVFIQVIIMVFVLRKLLKVLSNVQILQSVNDEKIKSAKRAMKFAIVLVVVMIILCIVYIAINIKNFYVAANINAVNSLYDDIMHSCSIIIVISALILGVYKKNSCCTIYKYSICTECFCGHCWLYYCSCCRKAAGKKRKQNINKKPTGSIQQLNGKTELLGQQE